MKIDKIQQNSLDNIPVILDFLQARLDKNLKPCTLKSPLTYLERKFNNLDVRSCVLAYLKIWEKIRKSDHLFLQSQEPNKGLPTCLVCVCLGTSVYCDDVDLTTLPSLPKETTYLYARFNKISDIQSKNFAGLDKLKYVDLSSNFLSEIDDDAFHLLPSLQELILSENQLRRLPELPSSLVRLNVQYNQLQSSGIRTESFKDLTRLQFLYLSNNKLDFVPVPLPESLLSIHLQNNNIQTMYKDTFCDSRDPTFIRSALEDIRLDANPINLSKFANDYFCLPRLPTGQYY
ncbi:opticin-like [Bufo bufo]|uniref:opticin-like n=1 Tax=Bufo bufo TaxID=8384 RepID=UPI001ABE2142|nr:opticin-like [Bufo bufo]